MIVQLDVHITPSPQGISVWLTRSLESMACLDPASPFLGMSTGCELLPKNRSAPELADWQTGSDCQELKRWPVVRRGSHAILFADHSCCLGMTNPTKLSEHRQFAENCLIVGDPHRQRICKLVPGQYLDRPTETQRESTGPDRDQAEPSSPGSAAT